MVREPGPLDKCYSQPCTSELYIPHSAVGYYEGWKGRLFSTDRLPNGQYTPYAAASVTGWFFQEAGRLPVQHYSLKSSCWASGTRELNVRGNAFENEGGPSSNPSEPLTDWQVECNLHAMRDIQEWRGYAGGYWHRPSHVGDLTATCYQHNESTWFGGLYTACPSGRAAPIWARLDELLGLEEDEMDAEDKQVMKDISHKLSDINTKLTDISAKCDSLANIDREMDTVVSSISNLDIEMDVLVAAARKQLEG